MKAPDEDPIDAMYRALEEEFLAEKARMLKDREADDDEPVPENPKY